MDSLTDALSLSEFPGAPFSDEVVQAACQTIRTVCGWHIAPQVLETITVDSPGGRVLRLPSLYVTAVSLVESLAGPDPVELTEWRWSQNGMLSRAECFPEGFRTVRVTFTHGYETCPLDLLPVIASRTQRRAMQESLGSRSVSFSAEGDAVLEAPLYQYKLGPRA